MSANVGRETAKIYAFPVKNRLSGTVGARDSRAAAKVEAAPVMDVGSWYHGEAIREAARAGDRQG